MTDNKQFIFGIHAVAEALEAAKDIDKILIRRDLTGDNVTHILDMAHALRVPVQRVPVERIDRITRKNHQGVLAMMAAITYFQLEQLLPQFYDEGINPFVVVLDGVTDVRNFGAIARTCECAGVNAIIIPDHDSVTVNADAVKTSAGALNVMPVCRERNLVQALQLLRDSGFMIVGTSDKNATPYTQPDYTGPVALVLGAEGSGISTAVMKLCEKRVKIPEFGQINSLNVSVAGGIMMYEVVRQRLSDGQQVK